MADFQYTATGYPQAQAPPSNYVPPPQFQPAAYPPPQPMQPAQQTVVVTTVSSSTLPIYQDRPVDVQCPNCQNQVTSTCVYENGLLVWIVIFIMVFVFQLWLGCCLCALCVPRLKDVRHVCPVCNYNLGLYKRI